MKTFVLCLCLMFPSAICLAETQSPQAEEPKLYDHYVAMQQMQQRLHQRSFDDQTRLQPQMQQAERRACQRLKQERHEGVPQEDYHRQGGDQFVAFVLQFERYCEMLREQAR